jgi:hypothetical protein
LVGEIRLFTNILHSLKIKRIVDGANFEEIEAYYDHILGGECEPIRRVLVELLFFHPAANHASLIVSALLSKKFNASVSALVESKLSFPEVSFSKKFGIKNFLNVYSLSAVSVFVKSMLISLRLYGKLKYEKNGGIKVLIDGIDIGGFIYDQYLRENNLPTVREVTLRYIFAVAKGVFLYCRYKQILQHFRPTDVVLSHNVYSKYGLIGIAAWSVDKSINVWQVFNLEPMNISCVKPSEYCVSPPRYYEKKWGKVLIEYYGYESLLSEYASEIETRYNGMNKNDLDSEFVYKNNEIETVESFLSQYRSNINPIFIFSHAFVDAVKYTKWQVFSDYYTWLEETLILLSEKSKLRSIFVKPHPSEKLYPCTESVSGLVSRINHDYNANFLYIDKKVHNKVIFDIANLIITSNGTVGMEAVAAGVPVIVAASCEYDEADIAYQAHDIVEYKRLISAVDLMSKPSNDMIDRAKICILAYSKYMYAYATFLSNLSRSPVASIDSLAKELKHLNNCYEGAPALEQQEIFKQFSFMIAEGLENCIYLDPLWNK